MTKQKETKRNKKKQKEPIFIIKRTQITKQRQQHKFWLGMPTASLKMSYNFWTQFRNSSHSVVDRIEAL